MLHYVGSTISSQLRTIFPFASYSSLSFGNGRIPLLLKVCRTYKFNVRILYQEKTLHNEYAVFYVITYLALKTSLILQTPPTRRKGYGFLAPMHVAPQHADQSEATVT